MFTFLQNIAARLVPKQDHDSASQQEGMKVPIQKCLNGSF